jgi:hypothetical protein
LTPTGRVNCRSIDSSFTDLEIVNQLIHYIYLIHININQSREKRFFESPEMKAIFTVVVNNTVIFEAIYKPSPGHGLELLKNETIFSYIPYKNLLNNTPGYLSVFSADHLRSSFTRHLNRDLVSIFANLQKPWKYLVNYPPALKELKRLVQSNQHHAFFKILAQTDGDNADKQIVLKAVLEAYATKPKAILRISWFNRLANKKRSLASTHATSGSDFETLFANISAQHNQLSEKANKNWFFSNRWKIRTGKYPTTENPKASWNENEHSELGFILKSFKAR